MYQMFEQKYKECEKSLFLVAFGYLHNTEDAKDCVQEAVLSALKSFNTLNNKEFFKLYRVLEAGGFSFPLLSEAQKEIVKIEDRNVLVQGAAGSGLYGN